MRPGSKAIIAGLLSVSFVAGVSHAEKKKKPRTTTPASMDVGWGKPIVTMEQMRTQGVVKQRWDISCGAAALSTLLTYDFKDNTPETDIVVWMLHRTSAARVRERHGFSLLDMKHFAQARGYTAEGYSDMSIQELASQRSAVIVPIKSKGLDHFVVVKGILAGRVYIADPGFGNTTMRVDRFQRVWKDGIVFIIQPPDQRMQAATGIKSAARVLPDETLITRSLGVTTPTNGLY